MKRERLRKRRRGRKRGRGGRGRGSVGNVLYLNECARDGRPETRILFACAMCVASTRHVQEIPAFAAHVYPPYCLQPEGINSRLDVTLLYHGDPILCTFANERRQEAQGWSSRATIVVCANPSSFQPSVRLPHKLARYNIRVLDQPNLSHPNFKASSHVYACRKPYRPHTWRH